MGFASSRADWVTAPAGEFMACDHKGKIKFYSEKKKFGFVKLDSGDDVFFHIGALSRNVTPKAGDSVLCDIDTTDERGPRAITVVFE